MKLLVNPLVIMIFPSLVSCKDYFENRVVVSGSNWVEF